MQSRFFLNIVVTQGSSIFKLFASKDQTLLIWRNTFFVLNLLFDDVNAIRRFNF